MSEDLSFKRFPEEKQEQIRQLVSYATLLGLTGKDLVSIGGKLDRMKTAAEVAHNIKLVDSTFTFLPVGQGKQALNLRFKIKTDNGTYTFEASGAQWRVTSSKTRKVKRFNMLGWGPQYQLGRMPYAKQTRYHVMLEVIHGKVKLDF